MSRTGSSRTDVIIGGSYGRRPGGVGRVVSDTVYPPEQSIVTARWRDIESAGAGSELSHAASVVIGGMFERRQSELLVGHITTVRVLEVRTARREPRTRRAIVAARAQVTSAARRVSRQRLRHPF